MKKIGSCANSLVSNSLSNPVNNTYEKLFLFLLLII